MKGQADNVINNISAFWNAQSKKYQYVVGEAGNKVVYDVIFKLEKNNAMYFENGFFQIADPNQATANEINVMSDHAFYVKKDNLKIEDAAGMNFRNIMDLPKKSLNDKDVHHHEAGHGLGMRHNSYPASAITKPTPAVMNAKLEDVGDAVLYNNIRDVLGMAGYGENTNTFTKGEKEVLGNAIKITQEGIAPEGFDKGNVQAAPPPTKK